MSTQPEYDESLLGYVRVSTEDQNPEMQRAALVRAGVDPDRIKVEFRSGAAKTLPVRELVAKSAREGDTIVVWKLDRIGRRLLDVYDFVMRLEKRGVALRSLTEYLDTKTPIGKLAFTMLAAFAELERDQIAERTTNGIAIAKARGVRFGAKPKFTAKQVDKMRQRFRDGASVEQVAQEFKCVAATVRKYVPAEDRQALRRGEH